MFYQNTLFRARFFNLKTLQHSLRVAFFCCWLQLPTHLWSQSTALLARQSVGLSVSDSIFVQKSLQLIPNDAYAYMVVHASGKTFKSLEGNTWNSISDMSLANRIAFNKAFNDKTIVLLSCGDTLASQNLTNALALLDNSATPKRNPRSIIGWDGEVEIYSNGYIKGTGSCRKFTPPVGIANPPLPIILSGSNIPKGSGKIPTVGMPSVILMNSEGYEIGKLGLSETRVSQIRLMWRSYKVNFLANPNNTALITDGEINNPAIFKSWLYIRVTAESDTKLTGNSEFMLNLYKVLNQDFYTANGIGSFKMPAPDPVKAMSVQQAVQLCVVAGAAKKMVIDKLATLPVTTTAQTVIDIIADANINTPLKTYLQSIFGKYPVPAALSNFDKNILILEEKLPDFTDILNAYVRTPHIIPNLPKNDGLTVELLDDLVATLEKDIVGKTQMLDPARNAITNCINQIIGEHNTLTYDNFIKLTRMKDVVNGVAEGLMNPNRSQNSIKGNIFEYWGTKAIRSMTPFPFFTGTSATPILLERKNPIELNNLLNTDNQALTVDGYFRIPHPTNPLLVAVEFKYAQDDIPAYQLNHRNRIKAGIVDHFVYVLAEQPTITIIKRIRLELPNADIYYFSLNHFTKIP